MGFHPFMASLASQRAMLSVLGNAVSAMQVVWVVMEAQPGGILPRLSFENLLSRIIQRCFAQASGPDPVAKEGDLASAFSGLFISPPRLG